MTKIEKEYKVLVDKTKLEKMIKYYSVEPIIQINHYFDSTPSLYQRGFSIRIRQIGNKNIFALKESLKDSKLEHEFEINGFNIEDENILNLFKELNINQKLEEIGELKTYRYLIKDEFGELCLDINEYSNIVDYEIEYELYNPSEDRLDHFKEILKKFDIEYIPNKLSKIRRFRMSLNI